jgi:subfamily B ATP-binding cassette protein MsbA
LADTVDQTSTIGAATAARRDKPQSSARLYGRLFREFIRPHLSMSLLSLLCMVILAATTTAQAWMMRPVLDKVFLTKASVDWLFVIAGAILAISVTKGIANYFQQVLMTTIGQRVVTDIQKRLFERVIHADLAYFQNTSSGELISRFTNDTALLRFSATQALTGVGRDLLSVLGLTGLMFYQDWLLASMACVVAPIVAGPLRKVGKRMRKVATGYQVENGRMTTLLSQVFQGARHVKAYTMEAYEVGRFATLAERIYRIVERTSRLRAASSPLMETLGGVVVAAIVVYGGWQVMDGTRTPGAFFSFITAFMLAYAPLKTLASVNTNLQEGMAAAERLFSVIDQEPRITDRPGARPLPVTDGTIRFEDVSFSYRGGETVLDHFDLEIPGGKKVALVGPSGGGKSTILNLVPRFYDVAEGRITIDGCDLRTCTVKSLRDSIALVSQEVSLFDDTIRANIAYGRQAASDAEIVAAAQAAAAHDFIVEMPDGYDTMVGEQGTRLSGGQRQRISIARAMLKNAPVLLLDEATSALDSESERLIQAALRRLMTGRTSIVIAHRLSTIQDADIIYCIENGRVVEQGTHEALMQADGLYARLWGMQFATEQDELGTVAVLLPQAS